MGNVGFRLGREAARRDEETGSGVGATTAACSLVRSRIDVGVKSAGGAHRSRISCGHYWTDLLDLHPIDFMGSIFRPVTYPLLDTPDAPSAADSREEGFYGPDPNVGSALYEIGDRMPTLQATKLEFGHFMPRNKPYQSRC